MAKRAKGRQVRRAAGRRRAKAVTVYRVGIDLPVILAKRGDFWIAQAILIDYAVAGKTKEDAKRRFEVGLGQTIHEHLSEFKSVDRLLATRAPNEDWMPLLFADGQPHRFTAQTRHFVPSVVSEEKASSLPFRQIQYYEPVDAAA